MTLRARHLRWTRGGHLAVDDITLDPEPGEMVGILGPNGCGKSSLLRILGGTATPDAGHVLLNGTDLCTHRRRHIARRVAMVAQHADTDVDITVQDIVRLGRIPYRGPLGHDTQEDHDAVSYALDATGMTSKAGRTWHTLSGGERQRTQIARALAQEPDNLLLDEPTNHLDIAHQLEILALVRDLPITSYIALHDLNLAAMFCDKVLVLDKGQAVAFGTPKQVITAHLVTRVYGVCADITIEPSTDRPTIIYRVPQAQSGTILHVRSV
ncbi:iron complex transport system ATP-binding protein [Rhodococcus rhodochrous J38]|uniref:ABC transporter ATP-binding protein n=1 Tax=Rhodococcus rhodochrous TaxID=1829 RepID=UPI0011AB29C0|nr:ABC transporter ATP-binding protein [Rhodococcus rhodochrous]TWH41900.1 iron complex transport system ATP-binding protein [Rhodococcus rhodochrous J38]